MGPLRAHLLRRVDTALALQIQDAGKLLLAGRRSRARRRDRASPRSTATRSASAARTGSMPSRRHSAGSSRAGPSSSTATETRLARALETNRVGQLSGTVGTYAGRRAGGRTDRLRTARARARSALDAGDLARPPRRTALGARARCDVARPLRDRDPPSRAHRGARGRGAVHGGNEGLLGDAAQAQSEGRRADLRPRAGGAGGGDRRARERAALARARHLAFVGRARRHPGRVPGARLHARPVRRGSSTGLVVYPDRMRRNLESSHGLFFSHRLLLALVETGLDRDDAYRLVQRNAMQCLGRGARLPRARPRPTPRSRARLDDAALDARLRPRGDRAPRRRRLRTASRPRPARGARHV